MNLGISELLVVLFNVLVVLVQLGVPILVLIGLFVMYRKTRQLEMRIDGLERRLGALEDPAAHATS